MHLGQNSDFALAGQHLVFRNVDLNFSVGLAQKWLAEFIKLPRAHEHDLDAKHEIV